MINMIDQSGKQNTLGFDHELSSIELMEYLSNLLTLPAPHNLKLADYFLRPKLKTQSYSSFPTIDKFILIKRMNGLVSHVDLDFHSCMVEYNDDYNIVSYIVSQLNNKGSEIIDKVSGMLGNSIINKKKNDKIEIFKFINMLKDNEFELSAPQIC